LHDFTYAGVQIPRPDTPPGHLRDVAKATSVRATSAELNLVVIEEIPAERASQIDRGDLLGLRGRCLHEDRAVLRPFRVHKFLNDGLRFSSDDEPDPSVQRKILRKDREVGATQNDRRAGTGRHAVNEFFALIEEV